LKISLGAQASDRLPRITGFLNPDGFQRAKWQKVGDAPVLTPPVNAHRFVVMLDPGHGGTDPGSIAQNGLMEKDLTLEIAQRVKELLSGSDELEILLTRNHDHGLSRKTRISSIRDSSADLVLSLHFNHLPQSELNVVETFYAGPGNVAESRALLAQREVKSGNRQILAPNGVDVSFTRESKRLANTLHRRIFAEVSHDNESVLNAGVREKTLFVLTQSYKPGALIEITCLSNVSEAQRLTTDAYRHRLASALADGIRSYHRTFHLTSLDKVPEKRTDVGV
jgi:N-acetylmuramoyl-L-alanine amidase